MFLTLLDLPFEVIILALALATILKYLSYSMELCFLWVVVLQKKHSKWFVQFRSLDSKRFAEANSKIFVVIAIKMQMRYYFLQ